MTNTLPTTDLQISTLIDEFLDEVAKKPTPLAAIWSSRSTRP